MGGVLASCGLKALRCWNLTDYATREAQALSVGFESQTRIRIARAVRNAAIVQTSHLQRILRVGYALTALSDTPKRTPKICGCCWKSWEVPGASEDAKAA